MAAQRTNSFPHPADEAQEPERTNGLRVVQRRVAYVNACGQHHRLNSNESANQAIVAVAQLRGARAILRP